ncbi:helix-turn-helix domain-containing protein [Streptomyces hydrogenans]|uniref:helix-turn-helix domain-containing protein n=1 Tax=Streptomyces hydrogenans TaxID=1873719 RepID=UPI00382600DE
MSATGHAPAIIRDAIDGRPPRSALVPQRRRPCRDRVAAEILEAVRLHTQGLELSGIAREMGRSTATVRRRLADAGVQIPHRRATEAPAGESRQAAETRQAIELYAQGLTLEEIGRVLGYTKHTVQRRLKKAGVERRSGGRRPIVLSKEQAVDAARQYGAGTSLTDIAEHLGVSTHVVQRNLGLAGVPRRSCGTSSRAEARQRTLTAQIHTAATLYVSGLTTQQIADEMGLSTPTVRARLAAGSVDRRTRWGRPTITEERLLIAAESEQAAKLYGDGLTMARVGAELGLSERAVRQRLLHAGVTIRPRGKRVRSPEEQEKAEADIRQAAFLYAAGLTVDEVADVMGNSPRIARRLLDSAGVQRRRRGRRSTG